MTTDQLRAYLDAHGVDGAPTVPGWYVVDSPCWTGDYGIGLCIWRNGDGQFFDKTGSCAIVERQDVDRHAPLPDFAAMQAEIERLRGSVQRMEEAARQDSGSAFRMGQVWESPTCITYRIAGVQPSERLNSARISMRQGADGKGRLFVKRGESTFGWRLVMP